ncbi:MAG: hypothetical protein HXY42_14670 [Chloroflexi bacterium]|nr:hypothetical protein [Chloroflexota bacterium]
MKKNFAHPHPAHTHPKPSIGWNVLYGERGWAKLRGILVFILLLLASILPATWFESVPFLRVWHNIVFPLLLMAALLIGWVYIARMQKETGEFDLGIMLVAVLILITILIEFLLILPQVPPGPWVMRYLFVPLAAFLAALFAGAKYVQDIYALEDFSLAFLYLISSQFGFAYPSLSIAGGKPQIETGKVNRLMLIGGPGFIIVPPSDAALVHIHPNSSKVYSATTSFLPRFSKIVEIVNLQDHRVKVDHADAYTKDGIKITIRDITLRFRICSDPQPETPTGGKRHHPKPYPYSSEAVRASVFGLPVGRKDTRQKDNPPSWSETWAEAVKNMVRGKITEYIASHQFDQIVTPDFQKGDPRKQIHDQLFTPEMENRLKGIGAKLLWCDIGHFEEDRQALRQHLETWSAKWSGSADVLRAEGEAHLIASQELGRAEAQAGMLNSIIRAFSDIDLSPGNRNQSIRNVILMRTAQVLESLIDAKGTPAQDQSSANDRFDHSNHTQEG